ncbi:MAG: amidohydrolase family protein, partial [Terriglobia bacterium]
QLSKEKRLGAILSPAWMPDSQYVIVSKSGRRGQDLHMYHINGGSGINLTGRDERERGPQGNQPSFQRLGAVVSPDERYLYFARRGPGSVYNQMSFAWEIYRRDLRDGVTDRVTQADRGAFRPLLSPDGHYLVYGTRNETQTGLRIRNLDTGEDRWLKYPVQRDDMESRGTRDLLPSYAFLSGGKEIVLTYGGKIHRVSVATGEAREIPFTATVAQDLGPRLNFQRRVAEGSVRSRLIFDPVQSPDGQRIVFSAMTQLYVMDLPEGTPRRLTSSTEGEFKPAWSPDGQWIAYVTWNGKAEGHIWKVRADGSGQPQRLTRVSAFYTDPVFSPDGERIVVRRGNAWMRRQTPSEFGGLRIQLDLIWLPAAAGDTQLIAPARGLSSPHFTRDEPDRIYFYSRDGLLSMRYDGTDRRAHLKLTGKKPPRAQRPPSAWDARVSPDGKWVLAYLFNQLSLIAMPPMTGTTPNINLSSPAVPGKQLTDIGADSFAWADGGKTITWSVGSTFFRRPLSSISFEPKEEEETKKEEEKEAEEEEESGGKKAEGEEEKDKKKEKKPKEQDEGVESFEVVLEFPRHKPEGTIVLRGATVITMKGDEIIRDADIVVTDNRIAAVGRRGRVSVPRGARIFDVRGKYVVPGFIDTHAHYKMRTAGVLEKPNWSFLANLAYGVTTGLDVQTSTYDYLAYFDLVEAGQMVGPRAYSTGQGVFWWNDFQSAEAAKYVLEKYKKYYNNHNIKAYVSGTRQQRQWVAQAAKELELTVTTEGALDLRLDMTHALDGMGTEHSLPIVPLYKDVVELFAQTKVSYTPTLLVLYGGPWAENYFYETLEVHDDTKLNRFTPHNEIDRVSKRRRWFRKDEHSFPKTAAQAAKIHRAGGLIGVGAHGQLQGLGYHWELWAFAMGGMTSREVLKAATIDGAEIIGLAQDLGSIEVGKFADLIVLAKDPLGDIRNTNTIRYVMKNGELFEGDTLNQVWPEQKPLAPLWWWDDKP